MRKLLAFAYITLFVIPSVAQELPMDYSYCGYHRSEIPIPSAKVAVYVQPQTGDNAPQLQAAIDYVSKQKPDKQTGFRGAVLLAEGTYELSQPLRIRTSGVVLRGSSREKTILRKSGYDRGALIYIEGVHDIQPKDTLILTDSHAGALTLRVQTASPAMKATSQSRSSAKDAFSTLKAGSRLLIWRPSTQEWIDAIGCASFGGGKRMGYWAWHPGDIDLRWHRQIITANGSEITLDAPLTCNIESRYGGAKAIVYEQPGLIAECGVENMTLESDYDHSLPMDESHCWDGIYMADAEDCWVRMINFRHFAGSAVVLQKSAQQITVEDCQSLLPVSEIGGFRRRTFLTFGEKTLFQRCYSEHGINDFAVGHTAPGPNAFVQCESYESLGPSGAISSWAPGLLFDVVNIDGNDLCFRNWELAKFGAGWSTANSTLWQSSASGLFCYSPDSLNRNYSIGCWGQIQGNGEYAEMNEHVKPYSLFADQLLKRRISQGESEEQATAQIAAQCRVLQRNTNASSSPTIEEAQNMAEEALKPRITMQQWIDSAVFYGDVQQGSLKPFVLKPMLSRDSQSFRYVVKNGWLTMNDVVLVGGKHQTPWWNGRTTDAAMAKAKPALTRFVPGFEGTGGTDRIDSVIANMQRSHTLLFSQNYGLWTDRRRDDHERIRRKNGDAWAPFYEQPFARIGLSLPNAQSSTIMASPQSNLSSENDGFPLAWDGMSKYDLTKLNKWYFWRLQEFSKKAESNGILLKNQHYFQHNILEAGAHWVDCPWRTANNVNGTPFLEPVNFTGDKRIFTATLFYNTEDPVLHKLHRQYIRQTLDAFKGYPNVIHSIGEEFTGPLHFVQFWLDVIAEWEKENGKVLVDLAVNKDVQDAILADPLRSKIVDFIDIEQWFYHNKGVYAPPGGVNMAQRQYMRKIRTGSARFEDVYRAVSEYRSKYPGKAVIYSAQKFPELGWASFMAGGSCAAIPVTDASFLREAANSMPEEADGAYILKSDKTVIIFLEKNNGNYRYQLPKGNFLMREIDAKSGEIKQLQSISGDVSLNRAGVYWLSKK